MTPEFNTNLRLSGDQYFLNAGYKNLIVLHHTAGRSAVSTFYWWQNYDKRRVATAYIVERDGTIYEIFDPAYWAFHLGLTGTGGMHDQRSIGIELASEGGLIARGSRLYAFDRISPETEYTGNLYDYGKLWRDSYRFFAAYTVNQTEAAAELINYLCANFSIPRRTPASFFDFYPGMREFRGIIGHHHVRGDKTDLHPGFDWSALVRKCDLELIGAENRIYYTQYTRRMFSGSIMKRKERIYLQSKIRDRALKLYNQF